MTDKTVALIAYQYAKPEKRDELKAQLAVLAKETPSEEGCEAYELHCLKDDPSVFFFYERWADQAALDKHFNSETFQKFWAVRMDYLLRDVEITFLGRI
ncbi:putative quinol monooxygenase [Chelatococcus asaccharovorans]|uniref:putative quinol monooxygenase n=1 Tax=Chelatococcus asaccharovorans TaxID=28210 RepID=UPI00224C7853|nr:putative quinol monooxygenase [Chelatococcus asaccharovorans]CAH1663225.1 Quinol monooxygenase YgiN [Chelatococcus asaccharovorans]CAH1682915.1 Quinol monooxygenase YgiN [Chelatococcus asaccharovorans]